MDDDFNDYILSILKKYFPNCELSKHQTSFIPDLSAISHNGFNGGKIPYITYYIVDNNKKIKDELLLMICKGPFLFVTFNYFKWFEKGKCWRYDYGSGIKPWESYGFFNLYKLDVLLDNMSKKFLKHETFKKI